MKNRGLISTFYFVLIAFVTYAVYRIEQILGGNWEATTWEFFNTIGIKGIIAIVATSIVVLVSAFIGANDYTATLKNKKANTVFEVLRIVLLIAYLAVVVVFIAKLENPIEAITAAKFSYILLVGIYTAIVVFLIITELTIIIKLLKREKKDTITTNKIVKAAENNIKKETKETAQPAVHEINTTQPPVFKFGKKK